MFGSMVSTQLGCTQSFQLYPLSNYFDIDGSLLVKSPSFSGGFTWGADGLLIRMGNKGLGFDDNFYKQFWMRKGFIINEYYRKSVCLI